MDHFTQMQVVVICTVVLAVVFDLTNGWNDASNAIATVVGTRVLAPWTAIVFGAVLNFIGAFFSDAVARTVGKEIADPNVLNGSPSTYLAAVVVAPIWITLCTWRGLPISCSHSLMGGLIGSVLATAGVDDLNGHGIRKIIFGVFVAPVGGFLLGMAILVAVSWVFKNMRIAKATRLFGKLQIASAGYMAFSHGTGDAQKAMGIITGALIAGGMQDASAGFHVQPWVRITCATAMGVGSAIGGWAVMKTLGTRLAHLKPHQGFAAEVGAASTIVVNTLSGVPMSTTHSITGAILGVGAAHGWRTVRWGIGKKIVYAWVLTFPVCVAGGFLVLKGLRALGVA
ncbi:MAG TPA: inorganic phosphate transporter [Planctomycetota bacterium]|nr:inorganic phosphate transporter [Planctomycetota bacterium]